MIISFGNVDFDSKKLSLTNKYLYIIFSINLSQEDFNVYMQHLNNTLNYLQYNLVDLIRWEIILANNFGYQSPKIFYNFSFYNNGSTIYQEF
jgi:hypothetical protein